MLTAGVGGGETLAGLFLDPLLGKRGLGEMRCLRHPGSWWKLWNKNPNHLIPAQAGPCKEQLEKALSGGGAGGRVLLPTTVVGPSTWRVLGEAET